MAVHAKQYNGSDSGCAMTGLLCEVEGSSLTCAGQLVWFVMEGEDGTGGTCVVELKEAWPGVPGRRKMAESRPLGRKATLREVPGTRRQCRHGDWRCRAERRKDADGTGSGNGGG